MSQALTTGSIKDLAQKNGAPLAETFLNVAALVLFDRSDSMSDRDCLTDLGPEQRYTVARAQLQRLQAEAPGKWGIVQFNHFVDFVPGGVPDLPGGTTNIAAALEFIRPVDGAGVRIILISDGQPDNASAALDAARKFKTKIETVYIGPEGGEGAEFLRRLADLTGGVSVTQSVKHIPQLAATLKGLLTA